MRLMLTSSSPCLASDWALVDYTLQGFYGFYQLYATGQWKCNVHVIWFQ